MRSAALALLLLTACAGSATWSKPGTTEAAVDADLKTCRLAAERVPTLPRPQTAPPSGAANSSTGTDLDADRQLAQAQLVERCMRERGYELVRK